MSFFLSADSKFTSTPKVFPHMKKVHVSMDIPTQYREWHWLLCPLCQGKNRLPSMKEIKRIKDEAIARLITTSKPAAGRKKSSPPTRELPVEKKPRAFSAAYRSLATATKLVIDLSSPNGKIEASKFMLVKLVALNEAKTLPKKITQHRSSMLPSMFKSASRCSFRAKFGSASKRLTTMRCGNVDSSAKEVHRPAPLSIVASIKLAKKEETAPEGSCKESIEFAS